MRLLDRYLLRELMMPLGACLTGFFIFWVAFDLLSQMEFFQQRGLGGAALLLYYWYEMPDLVTTVLPVGLLLALLYALTQHSRHNELTAIRAAGVSLWRICVPYWVLGWVFSVALYGINEHWAGEARERQDALLNQEQDPDDERAGGWRSLDFQNRTDRHSWSIGGFHLVTAEMRSPRVRLPMGNGAFQEFDAPALLWTNGTWRARGTPLQPVMERVYRSRDDVDPAERQMAASRFPVPPFSPDQVGSWPHRTLVVPELRWFSVTREEEGTNWVEQVQGWVDVAWHTNLVLPRSLTGAATGTGTGPVPIRWEVAAFHPETGELRGVRGRVGLPADAQRLVVAQSGVWKGGRWVFHGVQDFVYRDSRDADPILSETASRPMGELTETPAMLRSEARVGGLHRGRVLRKPQLTAQEVRDYYHLHRDVPPELKVWLDTQLHSRLAAPWTCVVVALIAIPFAAPGGRRNVFYGVAGSIAVGFFYFVLQRLGFALGQGGQLPPVVAAWLPNVVFGSLGIFLTGRVR